MATWTKENINSASWNKEEPQGTGGILQELDDFILLETGFVMLLETGATTWAKQTIN